jgi:hypothetical protein
LIDLLNWRGGINNDFFTFGFLKIAFLNSKRFVPLKILNTNSGFIDKTTFISAMTTKAQQLRGYLRKNVKNVIDYIDRNHVMRENDKV